MLREDKISRLKNFLAEQKGKVAVYGLKLNAQEVFWQFSDSIACFLDRDVRSGTFCGCPIVRLEDLPKRHIHAVVIAASLPVEPLIAERIHLFCAAHDVEIYGLHSGKLESVQMGRALSAEGDQEEALHKAIAEHEVISFDIFDTLLMRKVLYPTDVFDIVEHRLRKHGMDISGFKNYRVQAERGDRPHKDLAAIYRTLRKMLGWTEQQMMFAMNEELSAERQVILPRPGMANMVSYAHDMGKRVLLVSDMYLSPVFLQELLSEHGFTGYDELYVSVDRGTGKGERLFEIVKEEHPAKSYLHIGDNATIDGWAARVHGFDAWLIMSGLQMLRETEAEKILSLVENYNDRLLIGLFVAKAYSNPFACKAGWLHVKDMSHFASLFMAPLAAQYVLWILQRTMRHRFEAVLFAARDGWLFSRIYREAANAMGMEDVPPDIYFYVSRKLCISAALQDEKFLEWMRGILTGQTHHFLRETFGFVPGDGHEPPVQGENPDLIWDEVLRQKEEIFVRSNAIRQGYERYIEKQGLRREGHYAFTDLCSQGTTQCALTHSLLPQLYGLIFARYISGSSVTMGRMETFLPQADCAHMFANIAFEFVFTSLEPAVASVTTEGQMLFEKEDRSTEELKTVQEAQGAVIKFCHEFFSLCNPDSTINCAVGQFLLSMYQMPSFAGASSVFDGMDIKDDLRGIRLECLLDNEK